MYYLVMNIRIVARDEHFATLNAFPDRLTVLDNYTMARDVFIQSRFLRKALRAFRALVRFLGQVRHYMTLQGVTVEKAFIAHFADIRPIFTVNANVHSERFLILE